MDILFIKLMLIISFGRTHFQQMSLISNCDHAQKCDKCRLYFCANDELFIRANCLEPKYCSDCFNVKNQDPVMWTWYCDDKLYMEQERKKKVSCYGCMSNCIKHGKQIDNGTHEIIYVGDVFSVEINEMKELNC